MAGSKTFNSIARLHTAVAGLRLAAPSSSSPATPSLAIDSILDDLKNVKRKWRMIEATLADAEEREIHEPSIQAWLRELRNLAHMAEDLQDLYGYQVIANEVEKSKVPLPLEDPSFWKDLADRARKIKDRFAMIAEKKKSLDLKEGSNRWSHGDDAIAFRPRGTTDSPLGSALIGREEELKQLLDLSLEEDAGGETVEVIALVAMGGVGKTTLAQHVFQKLRESKVSFDAMGWVFVSEDFDAIRLTSAALNGFGEGDGFHAELSILQEKLCEFLEGKKFFLVLDDIWNKNIAKWETFFAPFKHGEKAGSKILITTREEEVVGTTGAMHCIRLESLTEEDGWSLLRHHAFANTGKDHPEKLVAIGKAIVEKCRGLPLAINVLGRLLYGKDREEEWELVLESKLWGFVKNRETGKQILGPLYFSYLQLPPHLKACFRFCSFLGRGGLVARKELVDLWVTHDVIKGDGRLALEDIANGYVDHLESRSFLECRGTMPVYDHFTIHDLMFDVAQYASADEFQRVDVVSSEYFYPQPNARHVRIFPLSVLHVKQVSIQASDIRTLHIHLPIGKDLLVGVSDPVSLHVLHINGAVVKGFDGCVDQAKLLRTLTYQSRKIKKIPESLFRLYNLRKLDMSFFQIKTLPDSICNLKNLRSLDLSHTRIRKIPEAICSLPSLRVLGLRCLDIKVLPESLHELTNLRELDLCRCQKLLELPGSLHKLLDLRVLNLEYCSRLREVPRGLTNLTKLRSLNVRYTPVSYLPAGLSGLKNLQDLPCFPSGQVSDGHASVNDLKNLVNLKDELHICNISNTRADEATGLQIAHPGLVYLGLHWGSKVAGGQLLEELKDIREEKDQKVVKEAEYVLQQLKPHSDIGRLEISGYKGGILPTWMGDTSFHNLNFITLTCCGDCQSISPLEHLPFLENLTIIGMPSLTELVSEPIGEALKEDILFFPLLQILEIKFCCRIGSLPLYKLSSLTDLHVEACNHLKKIDFSMPGSTEASKHKVASLLRSLEVVDCHWVRFSSNTAIPQSLVNLHVLRCSRLASWCISNRCLKLAHVSSVEVDQPDELYFPASGVNYTKLRMQKKRKRKICMPRCWSLKGRVFQSFLGQKRQRRKITGSW